MCICKTGIDSDIPDIGDEIGRADGVCLTRVFTIKIETSAAGFEPDIDIITLLRFNNNPEVECAFIEDKGELIEVGID